MLTLVAFVIDVLALLFDVWSILDGECLTAADVLALLFDVWSILDGECLTAADVHRRLFVIKQYAGSDFGVRIETDLAVDCDRLRAECDRWKFRASEAEGYVSDRDALREERDRYREALSAIANDTVDALKADLAAQRKSYLEVADAVARESTSSADLARQARETRAERDRYYDALHIIGYVADGGLRDLARAALGNPEATSSPHRLVRPRRRHRAHGAVRDAGRGLGGEDPIAYEARS